MLARIGPTLVLGVDLSHGRQSGVVIHVGSMGQTSDDLAHANWGRVDVGAPHFEEGHRHDEHDEQNQENEADHGHQQHRHARRVSHC